MAKRRMKGVKKIFPAKFNASRVNVGQSVDTFKTSVKTGHLKGRFVEVHNYRQRGEKSIADPYLDAKFDNMRTWKTHGRVAGEGLSEEKLEARKRAREIRKEEAETDNPVSILALLDAENELVQTSWKHQHVKYFHYIIVLDGRKRKIRLYISRDEYFFIEEDFVLKELRRSIKYGSQERAMFVYNNKNITWIQKEKF